MRYVLSRAEYEEFHAPPQYPLRSGQVVAELRTRGIKVSPATLDAMAERGDVDVPTDGAGDRAWGPEQIDKAIEYLTDREAYTPRAWQHALENTSPAQDMRAFNDACHAAPHLSSDYFVREVRPGAAGLGLYGIVSYRPMTDKELAELRSRMEQARKAPVAA